MDELLRWRPTCRWPRGGGSAEASWPSSRSGENPRPGEDRGPQDSEELLGQVMVRQSRALQRLSRIACRAAATYVRNGSVVDLQITKGEVAAMVAGSELYKIKIEVAPVKARAVESDLPGLRRNRSIRWSNCCRAVSPKASWSGCAARVTACFRRRKRSSYRAAARTGRTCASTWRRCSMASAPGSTKSPSFCSCCAAWMKRNCIDNAGQDLPLSKATPGAGKVLDDK